MRDDRAGTAPSTILNSFYEKAFGLARDNFQSPLALTVCK
jgi:hypothetical protein